MLINEWSFLLLLETCWCAIYVIYRDLIDQQIHNFVFTIFT